jgi:hypothetical protein
MFSNITKVLLPWLTPSSGAASGKVKDELEQLGVSRSHSLFVCSFTLGYIKLIEAVLNTSSYGVPALFLLPSASTQLNSTTKYLPMLAKALFTKKIACGAKRPLASDRHHYFISKTSCMSMESQVGVLKDGISFGGTIDAMVHN